MEDSMRKAFAVVVNLVVLLALAPFAPAQELAFAPDVAEPGSVEEIRELTTSEEYLPWTVSYVPASETVPSPKEVLGRISGSEGVLSSVAEVHRYFRALAEASERVAIEVIGRSEEGRDILVARISDAANLRNLDQLRQINRRLADPRTLTEEQMRATAAQGKVFYYPTGGLHSTETGSPEMLMELAYRLAVSERPEIARIRQNAVVLITPVVEVDGRDRQVEWYRRHLANRDLSYAELREFASPPYWGHYTFHDNNRDGMQLTQALTRAVNDVFWTDHPHVLHDLHESLPLLYISTGHGPYNRAIDPVTINEWTQFAHNEAGSLQAMGLPGVWTWGFWDGWWPGYLFSIANNHNATGRFYETFGNLVPKTLERELKDIRFVGKPVTEPQWYRPWPPEKKVMWSMRNNTNYMQAGVLQALDYAAKHSDDLLRNHWVKANRSLQKGRNEAPHAWIFPEEQRDPARLAYLVNQLGRHRIEVHRLSGEWTTGETTYPAGTYVVRMDQPYRNAAVMFLERQKFPADEPNPPYDDIAWTWPLLYGVDGTSIDDKKIFEAAMEPVAEEVKATGSVTGTGGVFILADRGQNGVLGARLQLGRQAVEVAKSSFEIDGTTYPAGSWIVRAPRGRIEEIAAAHALDFDAVASVPDVVRHAIDIPRIAVLHTWTTQDTGWVRYLFDREGLPYTLINPDDVKRGRPGDRFDVIVFPNQWGDFRRLAHGINPEWGPLAYTKTAEYPSHGIPDSSPDITGGFGFGGLENLRQFIERGGLMIAIGNAGTLLVDGGMVRDVNRASGSFNTPGSELQAKVLRPEHPVTYGYEAFPSIFRGNLPIFTVADRHRDRVVLQFGTKQVPEEMEEPPTVEEAPGVDFGVEEEEVTAEEEEAAEEPEAEAPTAEKPEPKRELVLSGYVRGASEVEGLPAILDVPVGKGRVLLYNFNPLHRYLNHSDFRLVYNAILNWKDVLER
jgi:hypothetical protein